MTLFHHVLVLPEPEESYDQAVALARRWIDVREANGADRLLTAVFYSRDSIPNPVLPDAAALLRHHDIQVASVSDLRLARWAPSQRRLRARATTRITYLSPVHDDGRHAVSNTVAAAEDGRVTEDASLHPAERGIGARPRARGTS